MSCGSHSDGLYLDFRALVLCQDKKYNFIRDLLSHLYVAFQSYPDGHRDRLFLPAGRQAHSKRLNLTQNILEWFLNLYHDGVLIYKA